MKRGLALASQLRFYLPGWERLLIDLGEGEETSSIKQSNFSPDLAGDVFALDVPSYRTRPLLVIKFAPSSRAFEVQM